MEANIPAGTAVVFGVLRKRMEPALARSIAELAGSFPEIQQAYLFGCAVGGQKVPTEVLDIIFPTPGDAVRVMKEFTGRLGGVLPPGTDLDMWPMTPDHPFIGKVRQIGRRILARGTAGEPIFEDHLVDDQLASKRRWWQVW